MIIVDMMIETLSVNASVRFVVLILISSRDEESPRFIYLFYLFGVLRRFQHCTGHITMGSWKGRGNQYI